MSAAKYGVEHPSFDPYDLQFLTTALGQKGYRFNYTPETPTTMDLTRDHILAVGELPAVFLTDHQSMGQGRGEGRVWMDKAGKAILMSIGLQITEESTPFFADMVALHIARVLRQNQGIERLSIKYPNDLVINDRKVGGILTRNVYDGTRYMGTNVGIGINAHYSSSELEGYALEYQATSLGLHTPTQLRRQALVTDILEGLRFIPTDTHVLTTNTSEQKERNREWRKVSSLLKRKVHIESGDEIVAQGKVSDTQIGKGIRIKAEWHDRFDETMKVRLVD